MVILVYFKLWKLEISIEKRVKTKIKQNSIKKKDRLLDQIDSQ